MGVPKRLIMPVPIQRRIEREGTTLIEAVLVLLLTSVLVGGGWTVLAVNRRAAAAAALRAEGLEAVRTTGWILGEEAAGGRPGLDWAVTGGDSLPVRAFRGLALVDNPGPTGSEIAVCYRGIRSPNPEKDSVLLLGVGGAWTAHKLAERDPLVDSCPGVEGGRSELWTVMPEAGPSLLGRLFEHGSYHLVDGALRYRRGEGGRQPITPVRIKEGHVDRFPDGPGGFSWSVSLTDPGGLSDSTIWRGVGG